MADGLRLRALLFDVDGVLADTERDGHRIAFNTMFEELGLPIRWSVEEYGRRLVIGGGKERLASLLTPAFVASAGLPADPEAQRAEVARWHARKTAIYTSMVEAGRIEPRSGVRRLMLEAQDAGLVVALVSTTTEAAAVALLERILPEADRRARVPLFTGDIVPAKKPAPDIYLLALERLGLAAGEAIAIEDSRNGLLAAVGAGLTCLVTVSGYTAGESFGEAAAVVSDLGEPGRPMRVLASLGGIELGGAIEVADLERLLTASRSS
jgi:HAD superfamily hydrolase (TIGR01509 family)